MLIIFVVIGHFIESSIFNNQISSHLYSFIYSFHMPLFIWLNGYFYKQRTFKEEIKKCIPFIEVCIISHLFFTLFINGGLSIKCLLDFGGSPSWYLLSLVYWRLLSTILLQKLSPSKLFLFGIIVEILTFICLPKYGGILSIMRTIQFYPFFLLGYIMKDKMQYANKYKKYTLTLGTLSIAYILYTSSLLQWQCFYERAGLISFKSFSAHSYLWLFCFRYSILISSIFISTMILLFAENKLIKSISNFGNSTLFVYFGQTIIFPLVIRYTHSLTESLIVSTIAIIVFTYFSRKPISKWLMNPITTYIANKRA